MTDWKERLTGKLEPVLMKPDPRPDLSAYHNLPCAIFHYPAEDEFDLRHQLSLLTTRLEGRGKRVTHISLADLMKQALEAEVPIDDLIEAEKTIGLQTVVETIHGVLSEYQPLDSLVIGSMPTDGEPTRDIVFLVRAGWLFPFARTSPLLEQLQGRIELPTILFYPGTLDGPVGLRFMGVRDPEHSYRPKIF